MALEAIHPAGGTARAVHQASMERIFGRLFTIVAAEYVLEFWLSAGGLSGQRAGSVVADLLLSLLLIIQGIRALQRPPTQRDLDGLAAAALVLLPISRLLAAPGSSFLSDGAYLLAVPIAIAWGALSRRLIVPVLVVLVVAATGVWQQGPAESVEAAVTTLATAAFAAVAIRIMRAGAREADAATERMSHRMASEAATLAAEEAERRVANAVHDDVLSVLRAVGTASHPLPWSTLVAKARRAQAALSRQHPGRPAPADLPSALRGQAEEIAGDLAVRCEIDGDLDVPGDVAEAIAAAAGEALRNVAAHAGVASATVTARSGRAGGIQVTIRDRGKGFDPARIGPASTGLRSSICARLRDAGGHAEITSVPRDGTSVTLSWSAPAPASAGTVDPRAWGRRITPSPLRVFGGFMLPQLLSSLALLCLTWPQLRWPAAGAAVYAGLFLLTASCARNLARMRISAWAGTVLTVATAILVAVGTLAVTPGTTNLFAYWAALESATIVGVMVLLRGPAAGLLALALALAALTSGLLAAGDAMPAGGWVSVLASPALGAGAGFGFLITLRVFAGSAERQLDEYRERLRRRARAMAMSQADASALEHARQVAGPVLRRVSAGQPIGPELRAAAGLASAALRDHLLAPGFLTPGLAGQVRKARAAGAEVTVSCPRSASTALVPPARRLLAAALDRAGPAAELALHVHPITGHRPDLLILRLCSPAAPAHDHAALCSAALECAAQVSSLGPDALLIRLPADHVQPVRSPPA